MRFGITDSALTDVSEWHVFEDDGETIRVLIAKPKSSETMRAASRFQVASPKADWEGLLNFIAQRWFLAFEGAFDANGIQLEDNQAHRKLMLEASIPLLQFVQSKVRFSTTERDEGNEDAASD